MFVQPLHALKPNMEAIHLQGFSAHYRFPGNRPHTPRLHCNMSRTIFYRAATQSGSLILMLDIEFRLICICQAVIFKSGLRVRV